MLINSLKIYSTNQPTQKLSKSNLSFSKNKAEIPNNQENISLMDVSSNSTLGSISRFKVIDKNFMRGSTPHNEQDIKLLKDKGVNKILCLRTYNVSETGQSLNITKERDLCNKYDIEFIHIPVYFIFAKKENSLKKLLETQIDNVFSNHTERYEDLWKQVKPHLEKLKEESNPEDIMFVHCRKGLDRSGIVTGMYLAMKKSYTPKQILDGYLKNTSSSQEIRLFPKSYLKTLEKIYKDEI